MVVPDDPRHDAPSDDELDDEPDEALDLDDPLTDEEALDLDDALELDDELDREQLIANARRRHGVAGGILAAGMFGLDQMLGRKPKEEVPVVVASSSDPVDIDAHGIVIDIDADRTVVAPPIPRAGERPLRKRAKRRREH